jgi:GTPase SAR1 family protein
MGRFNRIPNKFNTKPDLSFQICMAGPTAAGTSCLIDRIVNNNFSSSTTDTIGMNFSQLYFTNDSTLILVKLIEIKIPKYTPLGGCSKFIRESDALILLADLHDSHSTHRFEYNIGLDDSKSHENGQRYLVGNKSDGTQNISPSELEIIAGKNSLKLLPSVSAKIGDGVSDFLATILTQLLAIKLAEEKKNSQQFSGELPRTTATPDSFCSAACNIV